MDRQITDRDYLKMADLAYLPFVKGDIGKSIQTVFANRPDIKRDKNCNGDVDEKKEWAHILQEALTSKDNTYFGSSFLNDWKVYAVEDQNQVAGGTGFFGVAFQNTKTEEVVFAFRGTEGDNPLEIPKDMVITDGQIVLGIVPKQFKQALTFYDSTIKKVNLTAGMSLNAEIKTGKRRIIEFFLSPVMQSLDESLKLR